MVGFRRFKHLAFCAVLLASGTLRAQSALPDSPGAVVQASLLRSVDSAPEPLFPLARRSNQPNITLAPGEKFHWKGLVLQSMGFLLLQHSVRIGMANDHDMHLLVNKPYWSDYWASIDQFNWRRWNDGDSIPVNYIGHPVEGAIAAYLEIQNNPRDRALQFGNNRPYWMSRLRGTAWAAVYSTQWELGPLGESAIFNQGGFTYPIQCKPDCGPDSKYTNNTGWVDLVVTPIVGTFWVVGEDVLDRYVTDPLVQRHPRSFPFLLLRAGANPSRSLANILRGHYPWWRDYEHFGQYDSAMVHAFQRALDKEPVERGDVSLYFQSQYLRTNRDNCMECRRWVRGGGITVAVQLRRYLDIFGDFNMAPDASPESSTNVGGNITAAMFGLRSGYNGKRFSVKASVAPGFVSYSKTSDSPPGTPAANYYRTTDFAATVGINADVKVAHNMGLRFEVHNTLIRYKSSYRDPEGIGTPPYLYFLSHDNYINSTNWGVRVGPVWRF